VTGTLAVTGAATLSSTLAVGAITSSSTITERARSFAMGAAQTRTFAAGNFTGTTGTWTVASGDVTAESYRLVGDTMFYSVRLSTTTTAGGCTELKITIPGGFTAAESAIRPGIFSIDSGANIVLGYVAITSGGTTMRLAKVDASAFTNVTDLCVVSFELEIRVS
jgi:hypothetical protein